jgi:hypothetical protein
MTLKISVEGSIDEVKAFLSFVSPSISSTPVDITTVISDQEEDRPVLRNVFRETILKAKDKVRDSLPLDGNLNKFITISDFVSLVGLQDLRSLRNREWGIRCAKMCRSDGVGFGFKTGANGQNQYPFYVIKNCFPY